MEQELAITRNSFGVWITWIGLFIIPLLFYPWAIRSSWISNSDVHALLEFGAAIIALAAAGIVLIHFFATGRRFFMLISLGFILQGSEDLIHALYSFSRIWPAEREGITSFVPGTYVTGRIILVICFILALYMGKTVVDPGKRKREAILFNSIGFLTTGIATTMIINSPLPQFILPGKIISRPVDYVAAVIYLSAFFLFVRAYRDKEHRTPFMWCMLGSIIFGFVTQVYMVNSQQLYDAQFDMSHVVKIFSYLFPIFGIAVGTFSMYRKQEALTGALTASIERERISAAKAAKTEAERKRVEELQKLKDELEIKVAERTKELEKSVQKLNKGQKAMLLMVEDLNQTSKELSQANIRLKELDHLKSMFIASMSHELRTPLNSIIGFTGIILQGMSGKITEEQKKQLNMVKCSAGHLLALINDVIDVSKIEAGKIEHNIEEFNLSDLMKEVKDSFTVATTEKGLKMSLDITDSLVINSDERRTKQVIMNLVSNAVKFTDRGKIEIKAAKKDGRVEVLVRDTGIGIEKMGLDKLFKPFSRVYTKGVLKGGTGLGLYLSRKIADLLGGEIKAESKFGKGSVFTFALPLKYKGEKP